MLTSLVLKQRQQSRDFTRSINAAHKSNKNLHKNRVSSVFFLPPLCWRPQLAKRLKV